MKKILKSTIAIACMLTFTLIVSACSSTTKDSSETQNTSDEVTLNLIYSSWPPDMIAYLAQEKGIFEKNGVDVNLIWVDGISDAIEKRKTQDIHIWNYPLIDLISEYAERKGEEGYNPQAILVQDFSAGADAVITLPENNLNTVADLEGKKIGVEKGTIGEFFLNILLQRENLTLNDVTAIDLGFDDIPDALKSGEIDAGVTYEPGITEAVADGAKILVDSTKERGVIVDVYIAQENHINENSEAYKKFVKSILEAGDYYRENTAESADIMKGKLEMTQEEVIETFEKLKLPDLRDNQTAFDRSSGFSSLFSLSKQAMQYWQEQDPNFEQFDIDPLLNDTIVNSIK